MTPISKKHFQSTWRSRRFWICCWIFLTTDYYCRMFMLLKQDFMTKFPLTYIGAFFVCVREHLESFRESKKCIWKDFVLPLEIRNILTLSHNTNHFSATTALSPPVVIFHFLHSDGCQHRSLSHASKRANEKGDWWSLHTRNTTRKKIRAFASAK